MRLEDIRQGSGLRGVVPGEAVVILGVAWNGADAVSLTYRRANGDFAQVVLYRTDEAALEQAALSSRPFDAPTLELCRRTTLSRIRTTPE